MDDARIDGERWAGKLSPRLRQTLRLLLEGESEKRIAIRLGISPHTVHIYVKGLHRRLRVNTRSELLSLFVRWEGPGHTAPLAERDFEQLRGHIERLRRTLAWLDARAVLHGFKEEGAMRREIALAAKYAETASELVNRNATIAELRLRVSAAPVGVGTA